jgi:hypothetical protein
MQRSHETLIIPKKREIDRASTLMNCLRSMGLLGGVPAPGDDEDERMLKHLEQVGQPYVLAKLWHDIGDVNVTHLNEPIRVSTDGKGTVEGPADLSEFERSPVVFCHVHAGQTGCICAVSVCRERHIVDMCLYDPAGKAWEETLYVVAGMLGEWMRLLLGECWSIRLEVYVNRNSPCELPPQYQGFWLLLMCLLKTYLPQIKFSGHIGALRLEAFAKSVTFLNVVRSVLHQVDALVTATGR